MRFYATGTKQDADAFAAQVLDAAAERSAGEARAELTKGKTTIGTPRAVVSASTPSA
jgi:hypothetical protein